MLGNLVAFFFECLNDELAVDQILEGFVILLGARHSEAGGLADVGEGAVAVVVKENVVEVAHEDEVKTAPVVVVDTSEVVPEEEEEEVIDVDISGSDDSETESSVSDSDSDSDSDSESDKVVDSGEKDGGDDDNTEIQLLDENKCLLDFQIDTLLQRYCNTKKK